MVQCFVKFPWAVFLFKLSKSNVKYSGASFFSNDLNRQTDIVH